MCGSLIERLKTNYDVHDRLELGRSSGTFTSATGSQKSK